MPLLVVLENAVPDCPPGVFFGDLLGVERRDCDVELVSIVDRAWFDLGKIDIVFVEVDMVEAGDLDFHLLHGLCRFFLLC